MRAAAIALVSIPLVGLVAVPAGAAAQPVAIQNATVWVDANTELKNATVVIRDGRIAAVGTVAAPAGARVIDARGKVVTAGLIDASSRLGLSEVGAVGDTVEGRFEGARAGIFASYRVADGFNPSSVAIPIARTGGVTAVVATPSGGFLAGIGGGFATNGDPSASTLVREVGLYVNLGSGSLGTNFGSRGLAIARLRELFDDATRYGANKGAYDRNQSRKLAAGRLDLEALLLVKQRRIPLIVRAHRASDLRAALRLARELRIDLVLEGATEAWQVAAELAAANVPVVIEPSANLPRNFDRVYVREDAAALLIAAGVTVIIKSPGGGFGAANVRNLRQEAGIAVASGLTRGQALAAITANPARVFGLGNRGTLARGSTADVVLWSGDPLELSSIAELVFVGGVEQSLRTRQTRLLERYRALPATR